MRKSLVGTALAMPLAAGFAARGQQPAIMDDFTPYFTNPVGRHYPQVNSALQVKFHSSAPQERGT